MPVNKTNEIGYTGLAEWGGYIQEEFLTELRGLKGYRRFNEMARNCPAIFAGLSAIETSILKCSFYVESEIGEDDPRLVFINECLEAISGGIEEHFAEALSMLTYGWCYFETVYKREAGRLTWDKFSVRGQDTLVKWQFDDKEKLQGMVQAVPPTYAQTVIPIDKSLLYRTRVERNNPEGLSLLRGSWIPYYYWKNLCQIEGIGIERDLAGLPVITMPEGANNDENDANSDASKAAKIVRNIRNDEQAGVVLPAGWVLNLLGGGGSKQFDTDKTITRYESRILMTMRAQFLLLGQNSVGTQALSTDLTDFFTIGINTYADNLCNTFTEQAIKPLLKLNGMDSKGVYMTHSPAGDTNLELLGAFIANTKDLMTWRPEDEAWLRDLTGMPAVDIAQLTQERDEAQAKKDEMRRLMEERLSQAKEQAQPQEEQPNNEQKVQEKMTALLEDAQVTRREILGAVAEKLIGEVDNA